MSNPGENMTEAIYQQEIKDLAAVAARRLDVPDASATLDNPLCGDTVVLDLRLTDGRIEALGHGVKGCLLCKAAATVAARSAVGLEADVAATLADRVSVMLKQGGEPPIPALAPFLTVRPHKSRHGCVLLPFKALAKALGR
ncbi:MAG: iron-sulfur cluster assembly scaffold protein [Phaeospirillum sp.]|nr:iron-sulfur cluster assembly scaffold protein [Phaeospirillum sp.]